MTETRSPAAATLRHWTLAAVAALAASTALALDVGALSNQDAGAGVKAALERGSEAAVSKLGVTDGFFGNPKVKIGLPGALQKGESALRMMGLGKQTDELVLAMNRAAEAAVPQAKPLLLNAVHAMTLSDAKAVLTGGDGSVTRFFREKTQQPLSVKFLPIVRAATQRVGLAQKYNAVAGQGAKLGLVSGDAANVEQYVTQKALDGLYTLIAQEESAIRRDPVGTGSAILGKVFGSLK
jgi:hypothetical protein